MPRRLWRHRAIVRQLLADVVRRHMPDIGYQPLWVPRWLIADVQRYAYLRQAELAGDYQSKS